MYHLFFARVCVKTRKAGRAEEKEEDYDDEKSS